MSTIPYHTIPYQTIPVDPVPGVECDDGDEDVDHVVEEAAVVHGAAGLLAQVLVRGDQQRQRAGQLGLQINL